MRLFTPKTQSKQAPGKTICFLIGVAFLLLTACQKQVESPDAIVPHTEIKVGETSIADFRASVQAVVLQQSSSENNAISFSWTPLPGNNPLRYTIEAGAVQSHFSEPIELGSSSYATIGFLVKELNQKMSRLVPTGKSTKVEIRVKATDLYGDHDVLVYSEALSLDITTYQPITEYAYPQYIKLPGNYQEWELSNAPQIVSVKNDGEYEGYINFTRQNPQFMFVKGCKWEITNTFTNLGANKFGFGGTLFSLTGNAGSYFVKASTNKNTWNCTRINKWGIHGTAVTCAGETDPVMTYDAASGKYMITLALQAGEFRFRANDDDALTLGKEIKNGYDTPSAIGKNFTVTTPGYYTIYLNLCSAGNYGCALIKEFNVFACGKE